MSFLAIPCHECLDPLPSTVLPADEDLSANDYVHMLWKTDRLCMQLCEYLVIETTLANSWNIKSN